MSDEDWRDHAVCREADPKLFDSLDPDSLTGMAALYMCLDCPVQQECLDEVRPAQSKFDGIAGAKVWLNGKVVWE